MYYSADDFYSYMEGLSIHSRNNILVRGGETRFTKSAVARVHKRAMASVLNREVYAVGTTQYVGKWHRPWDVVPALKSWRAPVGDFGIGIEVEMGFNGTGDARYIANKVKNWRNITLDFEGGTYPIEATFPPVRYSRYGKNSQPSRYLQILEDNIDRVYRHRESDLVGIHVNVSKGGAGMPGAGRLQSVSSAMMHMSSDQHRRYFGRRPYGYAYNQTSHIEYKMFNSTTDWKALRRFVDISVELTKLVYDNERSITHSTVAAACEAGYTKR